MGFFSSKLEKACLRAYETSDRSGNFAEYEFMFNPESYTVSINNNHDMSVGIGNTAASAAFKSISPETVRFKMIIDGSGVDDEYSFAAAAALTKEDSNIVNEDIDFLRKHMGYSGDIHETRYLVFSWGAFIFPCRLSSAQINYTLFSKSGSPLRAEIDVDLFYDRKEEIQTVIEGKNSPDLTHVRVVKAHDQLPLMCEEIYGSPQYYLYVAKANNLDDFRNLKAGQEIYFPPIEK
ncbi:hypothetical protein LVD17_24055 [Fulvivirga ulvae]|uniref:CIS tube protein n=1 Tax=Fulvivirga ulvae TaxID=2904245 RepID=UPI001F41DA9E|nr:hypothetical protein [Fulvivirga ulvae]UII31371.1 hypothetical protein LVD17_24055 [Fulvivirga ulvae]